jgi:hypothetical protein
MNVPDVGANPLNTIGSEGSGKSVQSSVANAMRTQIVVGMRGQTVIEKISLRKVDGRWRLRRPGRGVVDTHSWDDAHRIMLRLVDSDIRIAKSEKRK